MRKEYSDFDDNFIEGKEIEVGDTVFVKHMANTVNRIIGYPIWRSSHPNESLYAKIVEIGKKSFKVEILEVVDINLLSKTFEPSLIGRIVTAPKVKCLQWGKGSKDQCPRCHWVEE